MMSLLKLIALKLFLLILKVLGFLIDNINWVIISILLFMILTFSSCMTTKTSVGLFKEQSGKEYKYSKSKQFYICWGLFPVGETSVSTPVNGQCQVVVRKNVFDIIVSGVTGGFIKSQTIKVIAKK